MMAFKRETSIHRIINGEIYDYPKWYYRSKDEAKKNHICYYCGNKTTNNRSTFCSKDCKTHWLNWAGINSLRTNSVRREIHKKFEFACTNCGLMFYQEFPSGVKVPRFYGERHHIIPLENGGLDTFDNQTLLCRDCHDAFHSL
jgi:hypothetical protein